MNTTGEHTVGWTAEPQGRGTIGLLWSCFATIFLCTWSAIHPNLPGINDGTWQILLRKLKYVCLTLLAPEAMAAKAVTEMVDARCLRTLAPNLSDKKAFFMLMGGLRFTSASTPESVPVLLDPSLLIELCQKGVLEWPCVSEVDIEDRSKADALVKTITTIQVLWFVAQAIGRVSSRITLTTIELFTLAMVACAMAMYICWWNKPYDVRTPIVIKNSTSLIGYDTMERVGLSTVGLGAGIDLSPTYQRWEWPMTVLICLIFGGIHLLGWNFFFATTTEKWLWRVSSIGCTILPIIALICTEYKDKMPCGVDNVLFCVALLFYPTMRMYMFVEMFVSLRSVPADAYQTPDWSQYFPAFG